MKERDVEKSKRYLAQALQDLLNDKYPFEDFVITKTLGIYKDPERNAHKVLADRMAERDPGNAPQVNSRIPFVYITNDYIRSHPKCLQGDRVENPDYIKEHNLQIDYLFYITNQILKAVSRVYMLEYYDKGDLGDKKFKTLVMKRVKEKYFDPHIRSYDLKLRKQNEITSYFKKESSNSNSNTMVDDNIPIGNFKRKGRGTKKNRDISSFFSP